MRGRREGLVDPSPSHSLWAVILNYNDAADTIACVESLNASRYPDLGIVVVDNCSTDDSKEAVQRRFPLLPCVVRTDNGGYAAGNNAGVDFALARGAEFILILNNDVTVTSGALTVLMETAKSSPTIGIVTCTARYTDSPSRLYYAGGGFRRWLCTGVNVPRGFNGFHNDDPPIDVDFVNGCVMLVRGSVFTHMGMLREEFFMYFEDLEFSRRVGKSLRLCYTPRAVVHHRSGGGRGWRNYSPLYLFYHTRNRLLAFRDDPFWYRLYVIIFTLSNVCAKSVVLLSNAGAQGSETPGQLRALWRGIFAGFRGEEGKDREAS
jgi:GT2 family glycosyltransferase